MRRNAGQGGLRTHATPHPNRNGGERCPNDRSNPGRPMNTRKWNEECGEKRRSRPGRSGSVALLTLLLLVLAGTLAVGQGLIVTNVTGIWTNVVDDDGQSPGGVSGSGTSQIRWGTPATSSGQSGYDFDADNPGTIPLGVNTRIAYFTHLNFPIRYEWLKSADLEITITFDDPRVSTTELDIVVSFEHDETDNGASPCAYPTGPNENGCADAVDIVRVVTEPVTMGGVSCEAVVTFGNGSTQYLTAESQENEIDLYLRFDCTTFDPEIEITKSGPDNAEVGELVTYVFHVSHAAGSDGSPVGALEVTDSIAGTATLTGKIGGDDDDYLEPDETWTYDATYTIQPDDPHLLENQGCVSGRDMGNQEVSDCDTHTTEIDFDPLLDIVKSGPDDAEVDELVTYVFLVSHAAGSDDSPVSAVTVVDTVAGPATYISGDTNTNGLLEDGETWRFEATYTILATDPVSLDNTGCVNGTDKDGQPILEVCDTHTTTVFHPDYSIVKTVTDVGGDGAGGTIDAAGDIVSYRIVVTNLGNQPLTGVSLSDPLLDGPNGTLSAETESLDDNDVLQVTETWTYTGTYTVQQADLDDNGGGNGNIDNTATVFSDQLDDQSDSASVPIAGAPGIAVAKSADKVSVSAADEEYIYPSRDTHRRSSSHPHHPR